MKISKFSVSMMALVMFCMIGGLAYADLELTPYFPVTLGSTWTYDNGNTVIVDDSMLYFDKLEVEISNAGDSGQVFLEVTENDMKHTGYSNPHYIMVEGYFSPNTLIKFPMTLGTSWIETITSNGYHPEITCEITQVSLAVEAGGNIYPDCMELTWSIEYPDGYNWTNPLLSRKLYFEENIGCIKRIDHWQDGSETTMEVVDYFIGPTACECDLNRDSKCDMQDWLKFGEDWGRTDCNEPGVDCECDLNTDGKCDMQDWLMFGEDWGRTDCPL